MVMVPGNGPSLYWPVQWLAVYDNQSPIYTGGGGISKRQEVEMTSGLKSWDQISGPVCYISEFHDIKYWNIASSIVFQSSGITQKKVSGAGDWIISTTYAYNYSKA